MLKCLPTKIQDLIIGGTSQVDNRSTPQSLAKLLVYLITDKQNTAICLKNGIGVIPHQSLHTQKICSLKITLKFLVVQVDKTTVHKCEPS